MSNDPASTSPAQIFPLPFLLSVRPSVEGPALGQRGLFFAALSSEDLRRQGQRGNECVAPSPGKEKLYNQETNCRLHSGSRNRSRGGRARAAAPQGQRSARKGGMKPSVPRCSRRDRPNHRDVASAHSHRPRPASAFLDDTVGASAPPPCSTSPRTRPLSSAPGPEHLGRIFTPRPGLVVGGSSASPQRLPRGDRTLAASGSQTPGPHPLSPASPCPSPRVPARVGLVGGHGMCHTRTSGLQARK